MQLDDAWMTELFVAFGFLDDELDLFFSVLNVLESEYFFIVSKGFIDSSIAPLSQDFDDVVLANFASLHLYIEG